MSDMFLPISQSNISPLNSTIFWHYIQRRVRRPGLRRALSAPRVLFEPKVKASADPVALRELRREGVVLFPGYVPADRVEWIRTEFEKHTCFDPYRPHLGVFSPSNPPPETRLHARRDGISAGAARRVQT
jgi:hypothetical protein